MKQPTGVALREVKVVAVPLVFLPPEAAGSCGHWERL